MGQTPCTADTSPEAYAVQLELLRRMSPIQRLRKTFALSRQLKRMAMDAIRRRHPEFDEDAVRLKFIELTYGEALADDVRRWQEERTIG
ncbi:MAG: hypothetical protein ACC628_21495 [Pirellulaceae bacterium]